MLPILLILSFIVPIYSIQCWNCVGSDCDTYSKTSKNWELITCPTGSVCQKTSFSFYSNQKNQSETAHTVRSCSYETGCIIERSKTCKKSAIEYAGKGCVDRYCCAKDQCNFGVSLNNFGICAILMALLIF
ncbi:unnamed protein product [Caenorhabditis angaria]|uniref:UPAR/Ly6 domain-containing protein n=1 Tax=Caenorhabditis angaria TaxID=860376 RepID=A0A9P1IFT1_9PELO|nr:unnamed protein product [Caenorhabditis angaria]